MLAITLTGRATIGGLIIMPEIRLDSASDDAFIDSDLEVNDSLASFILAAVYSF